MIPDMQEELGAIMIIVVFAMTILIGLLGLVVDVGNILIQKARLVSAVDALVLAGVQELPTLPREALSQAYHYGIANQLEPEELSVKLNDDNNRISAQAHRWVELFFLKLFGFNNHKIFAEAVAQVGTVSSYQGVAPFAILWDDFQFGEEYILKYSPKSTGQHRGNFGALSLGGNGANNYRNNIKYGYQGVLQVGDLVYTEPGNMSGPTYDGVKYRLNLAKDYPAEAWDSDNPRIIIVPVVDSLAVSGKALVTIVGFAAFYLESCDGHGNESTVSGRFIRHIVDGDIGSGQGYGLMAYRLIH